MNTKDEIFQELIPIFKSVLNLPDLELRGDHSARDIDAWDSLNHAILIGEARKHFDVNFKLRDVLALKTVDDLCELILCSKSE